MNLAERITAAIDRAEQVARAVESTWPGPWTSTRTGWVLDAEGERVDGASVELARHMITNDPAAALRRCAADRRVLERHDGLPLPDGVSVSCLYDGAAWPCDDIRDLAARYGIEVEA